MYKKILVPLDGSPLAEAVLPYAEDLAKTENAEIILLTVPNIPTTDVFVRNATMASVIEDIQKDVEEAAVKYVNDKAVAIKKDNVKVSVMVQTGPVPDTIIQVAENMHVDMIAMSTHGRTGIQRWLMGSVADQIIHGTHIPVMLIHPN
jgi:nucleotide-binding universal stress UspA family protein